MMQMRQSNVEWKNEYMNEWMNEKLPCNYIYFKSITTSIRHDPFLIIASKLSQYSSYDISSISGLLSTGTVASCPCFCGGGGGGLDHPPGGPPGMAMYCCCCCCCCWFGFIGWATPRQETVRNGEQASLCHPPLFQKSPTGHQSVRSNSVRNLISGRQTAQYTTTS